MQTKEMDQGKVGNILAGFIGLSVGFINFLNIYLLSDSYFLSVVKAGFAAVVCAFCGMGGKWLWDLVRKKLIDKKIKRTNNGSN